MTALDHLGATELRATVQAYRDALAAHREPINRLNVYPVPDGDTGTNMSLTLVSVCDDVDAAGDGLAEVCSAIAKGSLMGARGNSGVILSQVLRGLVSVVADEGGAGGPTVARALRAATDAAYQAVMRPVEGTILTVVREAAEAAEACVADDGDAGPGRRCSTPPARRGRWRSTRRPTSCLSWPRRGWSTPAAPGSCC